MPTYMQDHRFAMPTPMHAQTDGAREAIDSMIAQGHARRILRDNVSIVTDHGRPRIEPYDLDPVTASARRLLADADARGWRTNLIALADRCVVEGVRGNSAFRAIWVRGKAKGARWHERYYRFEWYDDPRPVGVNKLTHTALEGKRGAGMAKLRLRAVASPMGIPISFATLATRIKES